jgi:hypothetical protein
VSKATRTKSAKRRVAIPGESPGEERLLQMITALACELAVAREREDTLERLLEAKGLIQRASIESFEPTEAAIREREELRRAVISHVIRPIRDAAQRAADETEKKAD